MKKPKQSLAASVPPGSRLEVRGEDRAQTTGTRATPLESAPNPEFKHKEDTCRNA